MLALTLALSLAAGPAMAVVDRVSGTPDDYTIDLGLLRVQILLAAKGLYRGPVDGMENDLMAAALLTFHKAADLERTSTLMPGDVDILAAWEPIVPDVPDQPNRVEVDLERQVLHLMAEGEVVATLPISSGNGEWYLSYRPGAGFVRAVTPAGEYEIYYNIPRWRVGALGAMYRPWYFNGGIAIHGSLSVPAYPASHGCIRVTMDDAEWLADQLYIGLPVNVRSSIAAPPVLLAGNRSFADPLGMYS